MANTKIRHIVQDALNYAYTTRSLVILNGPERIGKSVGAQTWCRANPDKARLVSLTAGTTDLLFYSEIFDALGCGSKGNGTGSVLRTGIRETLVNEDLVLVLDEAHCLFGLSQKASIKRLEYIRTEFVNRGVPVVLIITPQFANRLSELEKHTQFNVNQLRGRVARWIELPGKPARSDIECVCRHCFPGKQDIEPSVLQLLTSFALESEYPFAAIRNATTELCELMNRGEISEYDEEAVKKAIGYALFTRSMLTATIPAPPRKPSPKGPAPAAQRAQEPVAPAEQQHCTSDAGSRENAPNHRRSESSAPDFSPALNRTSSPALTV